MLAVITRLWAFLIYVPKSGDELPFDVAAISYFLGAFSIFLYSDKGSIHRGAFRVLMFAELFQCVKELAGSYLIKTDTENYIFSVMVIIVSLYSIASYREHKYRRKQSRSF